MKTSRTARQATRDYAGGWPLEILKQAG